MRTNLSIITILASLVFSSVMAEAHSGGTDANGCHHETATGGYHCHGTSGGGSTGGSTSISTPGKLPACSNGQFYSVAKSECICGSGMIENEIGKCICKEGYELSASKTFCSRIPGSVKLKVPTRNTKATLANRSSKSSSSAKSKIASSLANCTIKGNISATKEKIYHVIGCPNYNQTIIESSKGEMMFCSEADARSAGWRKALNCK